MGKRAIPEKKRLEIISLMKLNNNSEIARRVGVSEKCVRTTLSNFKNFQMSAEKPRSGRPKKTNSRDESLIFREVRKNPMLTLNELTNKTNFCRDHDLSSSTIDRVLKKKK